ncbi:hypothetical protein Poli38472_012614 [Pythium oligandrum]|uniref:FYVE-type domain-containing protein n=1 Tax=Pythium oligandrum TaxID=41045 RepID=A0A8K1FK62_PYTOL|nr:hypothetical protein Poli38472_012614 [Pythium oligandrum]|eukprot:TMW61423.1 hypothetical protein Poli38472_012614 [Pythium oligandrum]
MRSPVPESALPSITLSPEEERQYEAEVEAVIAETLRVQRRFAADGSTLEKKHWKTVRSKEDFHVYKSTKSSRRTTTAVNLNATLGPTVGSIRNVNLSSNSSSSSDDDDGIVASIKDPNVPLLIASGRLEGHLDDAMFACFAGDDLSWRQRSTYLKDRFAEARILATIQAPTPENPFNFLGIKWFMKEQPPLVGSFVQPRDFLILEASGTSVDEMGERYGYYLVHSIAHPKVPAFNELNIIRSVVSLCLVSRQVTPETVHTFARGFSDPRGDLIESIAVSHTADTLSAFMNAMEGSYVKKLTWMIQEAERRRELERQYFISPPGMEECDLCQKPGGKNLTTCRVCAQTICVRCTVTRKILVTDTETDSLNDCTAPFCFACVLAAKTRPAREVAIATSVLEAVRRQPEKAKATPDRPGSMLYTSETRPQLSKSTTGVVLY